MAFSRVSRFLASRKDFKEDKDQHTTNLRLLEAYLEEAKDWLPLLVKDATPQAADVQLGTTAIVFVSDDAYVWKPSTKTWVKMHDASNASVGFVAVAKWGTD